MSKKERLTILFGMIILGMLGIGFGAFMEEEPTDKPAKVEVAEKASKNEKDIVIEEEAVVENEVKEEVIKEEEIVEQEVKTTPSEAENAYIMLDILKLSFEGIGKVEYNEAGKAYNILPTDAFFIKDLLLTYDGAKPKDDWNSVVETTKTVSSAITEKVGPGYIINILNPTNPENIVLVLMDGQVLYNVMDEI